MVTLIKRFMERVHLGKICEEVKVAQWGRGRMWSPWKMHFSLIPLGALEYKLLQSQAHMEAKGLAFCTLRQSITDQVLTQGGSIL